MFSKMACYKINIHIAITFLVNTNDQLENIMNLENCIHNDKTLAI